MKFLFYILASLLLCTTVLCNKSYAQVAPPVYDPNPTYNIKQYNIVEAIVEKGDTIALIHLKPIVKFRRKVDTRRYDRLVRNLKIVYPIAKYANYRMLEMEQHLTTIKNKREQDKYIKSVEKELKAQYTPILKRMSFSQGKILIKLIDRQTGNTSYELVKEFRGNFSAFFWQGMARIFGANLKDTYDKEGEDKVIEELILLYEAGLL